ncbi:MAG: TIGR03545 family protein [Deltaproteobacteria bacterium]|nr:TIGR03545 family protein [Deltaproteobacteria bacterium]MBW1929418.1 TIGR03545 family protein [Deltaproteobacteria bacterium]
MKKWIRWQGLGVFVIVIVLLCTFWFLFIDGIVEHIIENYASKAIGAKVELDSADLSLFPAGLELRGLKVTNPDEPMKNAVEITRAEMSFDTLMLFRRKVIVNQMTLDGIKLNTPRKTSGALPRLSRKGTVPGTPSEKRATTGGKKKGICEGSELPSLHMPSVKEILSKEQIPSIKLAASLKEQIDNEKKKWQQRLASLPDKKTFDAYKLEIQKLKTRNKGIAAYISVGGKFLELKKKINADLDRIKKARKSFQKEIAALRQKMDEAKRAPFKDAAQLAQKYGMSKEGIANLSRVLFGVKICGWMQKSAQWYEKMRPVLQRVKQKKNGKEVVKPLRGKGAFVRFKEWQPLPDFLIREARASLITGAGNIKGVIKNITPDQDILGIPLTFSFKGERLKGFKLLEAKGILNHVKPRVPKDEIRFLVKGYQAKGIPLLEKGKTPIVLEKALADLNVKAVVQDTSVNANVLAALHAVNVGVSANSGNSPLMHAIISTLKNISKFIVNAKVTGTIRDYNIELSSDLDGVLKKSAGKIIAKETEKLRQQLIKAIMARIQGPLSQAEDGLSGLNGIDKELAERLNLGTSVLGGLGKPGKKGGFKLPFS